MPSPFDAETIQDALKDLVTLLLQDLHELWRLLTGEKVDAAQTRDMLIAAAPDLVNTYAAQAAVLTAAWYDELAPSLDYRAVTAPLPAKAALDASTRWAVSPLFGPRTASTEDDVLARLASSMQRRVFDASRDTVVVNVAAEGALWARYASATACAFCRLLATREAVYRSEESAIRVVGGRRTRGSRAPGTRFHDNCRCIAVPVRPGDSYQPPEYVEGWLGEYNDARRAAQSGDPAKILREMRKNDNASRA